MGIEKATILNIKANRSIVVPFNPEEYALDAANTFGSERAPKGPPTLQFNGSNLRRLSLDLFFDGLEGRVDVRGQIGPILQLLEKEGEKAGPPLLLFSWGGFQFRCVLESAGQRYTHFLAEGTPVRATLKLSFIECEQVEWAGRPSGIPAPAPVHQVVRGETLSQVAARTKGDPGAWKQIAEVNDIDNPRKLAPGRPLIVPPGRSAPRRGRD